MPTPPIQHQFSDSKNKNNSISLNTVYTLALCVVLFVFIRAFTPSSSFDLKEVNEKDTHHHDILRVDWEDVASVYTKTTTSNMIPKNQRDVQEEEQQQQEMENSSENEDEILGEKNLIVKKNITINPEFSIQQDQEENVAENSSFQFSTLKESKETEENERIISLSKLNSSHVSDWKRYFYSEACLKHRMAPVGRRANSNVGQGQRAKCVDIGIGSTLESKQEIPGVVHISLSHKIIYVPVMKAGTQMFYDIFMRRFHGIKIEDIELKSFLSKRRLDIKNFFVFTFVRDPFSMFRSGYGEVSLYAGNSRVRPVGFVKINQTKENEPRRAIQALNDIKRGVFSGLVPAHMFTQVWKINRCYGFARRSLKFDFIGHIENAENDWKEIERILGLEHHKLPLIHASSEAPEHLLAKKLIRFDSVGNKTSPYSELTKHVCDYYRSDFECFGYSYQKCLEKE